MARNWDLWSPKMTLVLAWSGGRGDERTPLFNQSYHLYVVPRINVDESKNKVEYLFRPHRVGFRVVSESLFATKGIS